jgi:hypothetical protein
MVLTFTDGQRCQHSNEPFGVDLIASDALHLQPTRDAFVDQCTRAVRKRVAARRQENFTVMPDAEPLARASNLRRFDFDDSAHALPSCRKGHGDNSLTIGRDD